MPGARIEVVETDQGDGRLDQTGVAQDGQRQRTAHGGGVGVAPDVIQADGGGKGLFGRGADVSLRGGRQRLALLNGERAGVGRFFGWCSRLCNRGGKRNGRVGQGCAGARSRLLAAVGGGAAGAAVGAGDAGAQARWRGGETG